MISDIITIDNQGRGFDNALEEGRQKYPIKATYRTEGARICAGE